MGASDLFADPQFVSLNETGKPLDVRLREDSPAVDRGVQVPVGWPDPLRKRDQGKPDIGAIPLGVEALRIGLQNP